MNLQPASRREIRRISAGTLFCSGILSAVLLLLGRFGIGPFDPAGIALSVLCASAVAVLNFIILCFTVQSALGIQDPKKRKARFQISYNFRMLLQAGWVVIALLTPWIHPIAGSVPLLFPNLTIFFLRFGNAEA